MHQFVLAEVVCAESSISYATCGTHEVLQKIHRKSSGEDKFLHMSENHDFERFGGIFSAKI